MLRYIDVALVGIGAAVAISLGAPPVGYAIGAVTWILQRIVQQADARWIARIGAPLRQLGYRLFEAFGRIWLLAGGIVVAGVISRADGLTAALVIFGAYSVTFAIRLLGGPPRRRPAR
jgi:hypothetical protein